ncbi:MAG: Ig-like domain-containing protein, partial [Oscillospiraceae bacterium]|nr:Ig-like domain-containing protein [Oscillospiraceae bacterium]
LPQKILHVGETLALTGVPSGATLVSSDESVLTVTNDGKVTGVKIGKATVTVDGTDLSVEIPVVGANVIPEGNRYFENGVYHDTEGVGTTTDPAATEWTLQNFGTSVDDITLPGRSSAVKGLSLKYVKGLANRIYPQGGTGSEDELENYFKVTDSSGKIYELTAWVKVEKDGEKTFPATKLQLYTYFLNGTSVKSKIPAQTFTLDDTGMDWSFVTISGLYNDIASRVEGYNNALYFAPRFDMAKKTEDTYGGIAYLTEFSVHEVVFDKVWVSDAAVRLNAGETKTVTSKNLSTTGTEFQGAYLFNGEGTDRGIIKPTYKSNNTSVATVDDAGVITAVAAGSTTVEVSTTIGNVTKTATVDVVVTGGTTPEPGPGTDPEPEPEPEPEPDPEPDGVAVPDAPIEGLPEYQGEPIVYNMTSGAFDLTKMYLAKSKDTNNFYVYGDSGETVNRTWVDGRVGSSLIRNQGIASWKPCITTNAQGEKVEAFTAMKETEPKWAIEHPTKYLYKDGAQNYLASCLNPQVNTNYVRLDLVEKYWNEPNNGKHKEAPGPYLAVRLLVENAGRYSLSIGRGTTSDTGVRTHVHMIKADPNKRYEADEIDGLLKEAKYVGIHSSLKGDPKEITSVTDFWVNVPEAGEYLLIFTPSKDSNAGTSLCYLNKITLGPIIRTLTKVAVTAEKPNLFHGETTTLDYALFNNDDTPYVGESSVYWYESSDPLVASVSQDGVVTAHNAGKADIILYVESAGIEVKGSVSVTVADNTPLAWAEIIGPESVEAGFEGSLSYRAGHVSGSPANPDVCTVSYRLANPEDEKYLKVNSQTGVITGVSACDSVTVIAKVTCGEYTIDSDPFEIKVTPNSPKSKFIDFRKPGSGYASDVMIDQYGWRINAAKTSSDVSAPSSSKLRCYSQGTHAQITSVGQTQKADLAIDIQVDYDGWYEIDFLGTQYYRGAKSANLYMDGAFMGNFCFWTDMSTNRNYNALKSLNTMYLTRGVHTIIFRAMTKSPEGNYSHMIPAYLQLSYVEGVGGLESVELSAEKTSMAAGETTTVTPKVILGGGREYSFGNKHGNKADPDNNITFSSSDSNVVSVSGSKLTAIAPGKATITATAKIGDDTLSNTIDITVTGDTLSRVEFVHPQYDIFVNGSGAPAVNAYLTNGRKIDSGDISVEYIVEDTSIATMESKTKLVGKTVGSTTIKAKVTFNGNDYFSEPVALNVLSYGFATLTLGAVTQVIKNGGEGTDLFLRAYDNDGQSLPIPAGAAVYSSADENVLTVDGNGRVTPVDVGVTDVTVTVTLDGVPRSEKITISVRDGKV